MKHSNWLIIYDICHPLRLRRVEKVVSRYGVRVQKSVFEADTSASVIEVMENELKRIIKENDSIGIFPLCEQDWQKAEKHGEIVPNNCLNGPYGIL